MRYRQKSSFPRSERGGRRFKSAQPTHGIWNDDVVDTPCEPVIPAGPGTVDTVYLLTAPTAAARSVMNRSALSTSTGRA